MDNYINQVRSARVVERISIRKQKSTQVFFYSWSEILLFLKYFIKYKAQTNDRFYSYCDCSVESVRLSSKESGVNVSLVQ